MPGWNDVLLELQSKALPLDEVRRNYLKKLNKLTKRNVICYYSGWLQRPGIKGVDISDVDKNGFMNAVYKLDRKSGLDLILHTPGGDVAAAESIINYLRKMFGINIRAIIPQLAMSSGTLIACGCKSIMLGKHSNIGPVDPHFNGIPVTGVLEEFDRAIKETSADPKKIAIWQVIISKYHPSFIGQCQKAIDWAQEIVTECLKTGMFLTDQNKDEKAEKIAKWLTDTGNNKTHSRHFHIDQCCENELVIEKLEDDPKLQDLILTVHHAYMHTLANAPVAKMIENHLGNAIVSIAPTQN